MVKRSMVPVFFIILFPISIGAGILGDLTIGKDLNARHGDPGVGIAFGYPIYVTKIDPRENTVTVGTNGTASW
jgi:hypothetical protein